MIHILIIDSNEDRQRWFADALAVIPDCHVDTAIHSYGALLHLRSRRYDLVLIDDFLSSDSKTGAQIINEMFDNPSSFFWPKRVWAHAEYGEGRVEAAVESSGPGGSEIAMRCSTMRAPVIRRPFSLLSMGTSFMDKVTSWLELDAHRQSDVR